MLDQGASRTEIAGQFTKTTEALSTELDNLYEKYLGRQADAAGVATFLPLLASGSEDLVQARILGSPEYASSRQAKSLTDYLAHPYVDHHVRPADPTAQSFFTSAQFAGDRTVIAFDVLHSPEAARQEIKNAYETYLQRQPDNAGLGYWTQAIGLGMSKQDFASGLLGSDEYFNSPHANQDTVATTAGTAVVFNVAVNDLRLFGRSYEVELIQNPSNGTAAVREDGSIIYLPGRGFTGTDVLTYRLHTDAGVSSLGLVKITVNAAA